MKKYPKGSEWRKWDLHIHAPSKYTCAKHDRFTGNNLEEKQTQFIQELKTITDVPVLGITDYFSLEGYKFVISKIDELPNCHLVIPNIELRISPVTGANRKINLHFLPNTEILSIEEIERFLHKFEFGPEKYTCKEDDLIQLGKKTKPQSSDEEAFKLGLNEFCISYDKFFEIFNASNEKLKRNILIGVSNNSGDGASGIKDVQGIRDIIYNGIDFIFSSQPSDRKYFIGESVDSANEIISKYGGLIPCFHGSDYHGGKDGKKVCIPDLNRFCWIKANTIFEGLRQTIFEPKDRVAIQENQPEQKLDSNVINRVRFIPKEGNPAFSDEWIELNSNLNTIIGGKSSGKSLLLSMISKTIDNSVDISQYDKIITEYLDDFEVEWKDGIVFKFSEKEFYFDSQQEKFQKRRPISHIPQLAIHKLIEEKPEEYKSIILNFLKEEDSFKEYYEKFEQGIDNTIEKINTGLTQLFKNQSILDRDKEELKHLGDFNAKKNEAKQLDARLKSMGVENLTEPEKEEYLRLKKSIELYNSQLENKKELVKAVNEYQSKVSTSLIQFEEDIKESCDDIANFLEENNETEILKIRDEILKLKDNFSTELQKVFEPYSKTTGEIKTLNESIEKETQAINKYIKKTGDENQIKEIKEKLAELNEEVKEIEKFEQKAKVHFDKINEAKDKILDGYETLIEKYRDLKREINLNYKELIPDDGISLKLEIEFNQEAFNRDFVELFDRRFSISNVSNYFTNNTYTFNISTQKSMVADFLDKLIKEDSAINFKKNFEFDKAIRAIVSNYFLPNFKLSQGGEEVENMSYGKRSLVLLKLYLALNKNENPILIDQPEDNLDNRTIYSELKEFIREKKRQRQIIVVTHNANLVVATDSECIIVASQDGIHEKINESHRFEYVSGALENTFQNDSANGILNSMGLKEHVCDVLEGGKRAFEEREQKYGFK